MADSEFEREIEALVLGKEVEREKLARRAEAAQSALAVVEQEIAHLQESLRMYREAHNISYDFEVDEGLRRRLGNKSTREALAEIMRDHEGVLTGKEACRILLRAGMFKDFRNASSSVYSTFNRYPKLFERIGRGRYKLLAPVPQVIRPASARSEVVVPTPVIRTHPPTVSATDKAIDDVLSA